MSWTAAHIEARIAEIEQELALCAPLVQERERLLRARAAILGEPEPAVSLTTRRITRRDVFAYLRENPGSRAGEIAGALGAGQPAVSAHLYRGRDELFANRGGRWYARGPAQPT